MPSVAICWKVVAKIVLNTVLSELVYTLILFYLFYLFLFINEFGLASKNMNYARRVYTHTHKVCKNLQVEGGRLYKKKKKKKTLTW